MNHQTIFSNRVASLCKWCFGHFFLLLTPRSTDVKEAFHERNIRVIVVFGMMFIVLLFFVDVFSTSTTVWDWYLLICGIGFASLYMLHRRKVVLAGRILTLISLTIFVDVAKAYWSPGTVLMNVIFTFVFLLILPTTRTLVMGITLNIGVYVVVILSATTASPLNIQDNYATPVTALIATLAGHLIVLMLGLYIRHDQIEKDRHELMLQQQHKESLQKFMNNVSHDLNTPLTTIKTSIYLLKRKSTENQHRHISVLEHQSEHLETLVASILEMSRLDLGVEFTITPFDINITTRSAVDAYQEKADKKVINLQFQSMESQAMVNGDPDLIFRALGNIIENAVVFTPTNGAISVSVKDVGRNIAIEVEDNGIGIRPEHLARIFERFYRVDSARNTSTGRCGLGLSITQTIIDLHNGKISVTSEVDRGTHVSVLLPKV